MGVNIFPDEDILFPIELTEIIYLRPDKYPPLGKPYRVMRHKPNGECIALTDNGFCSINDFKPKICKDFERGSKECLDSLDRLGE